MDATSPTMRGGSMASSSNTPKGGRAAPSILTPRAGSGRSPSSNNSSLNEISSATSTSLLKPPGNASFGRGGTEASVDNLDISPSYSTVSGSFGDIEPFDLDGVATMDAVSGSGTALNRRNSRRQSGLGLAALITEDSSLKDAALVEASHKAQKATRRRKHSGTGEEDAEDRPLGAKGSWSGRLQRHTSAMSAGSEGSESNFSQGDWTSTELNIEPFDFSESQESPSGGGFSPNTPGGTLKSTGGSSPGLTALLTKRSSLNDMSLVPPTTSVLAMATTDENGDAFASGAELVAVAMAGGTGAYRGSIAGMGPPMYPSTARPSLTSPVRGALYDPSESPPAQRDVLDLTPVSSLASSLRPSEDDEEEEESDPNEHSTTMQGGPDPPDLREGTSGPFGDGLPPLLPTSPGQRKQRQSVAFSPTTTGSGSGSFSQLPGDRSEDLGSPMSPGARRGTRRMTRHEKQMFQARFQGLEMAEFTSRGNREVIEQPEEWAREIELEGDEARALLELRTAEKLERQIAMEKSTDAEKQAAESAEEDRKMQERRDAQQKGFTKLVEEESVARGHLDEEGQASRHLLCAAGLQERLLLKQAMLQGLEMAESTSRGNLEVIEQPEERAREIELEGDEARALVELRTAEKLERQIAMEKSADAEKRVAESAEEDRKMQERQDKLVEEESVARAHLDEEGQASRHLLCAAGLQERLLLKQICAPESDARTQIDQEQQNEFKIKIKLALHYEGKCVDLEFSAEPRARHNLAKKSVLVVDLAELEARHRLELGELLCFRQDLGLPLMENAARLNLSREELVTFRTSILDPDVRARKQYESLRCVTAAETVARGPILAEAATTLGLVVVESNELHQRRGSVEVLELEGRREIEKDLRARSAEIESQHKKRAKEHWRHIREQLSKINSQEEGKRDAMLQDEGINFEVLVKCGTKHLIAAEGLELLVHTTQPNGTTKIEAEGLDGLALLHLAGNSIFSFVTTFGSHSIAQGAEPLLGGKKTSTLSSKDSFMRTSSTVFTGGLLYAHRQQLRTLAKQELSQREGLALVEKRVAAVQEHLNAFPNHEERQRKRIRNDERSEIKAIFQTYKEETKELRACLAQPSTAYLQRIAQETGSRRWETQVANARGQIADSRQKDYWSKVIDQLSEVETQFAKQERIRSKKCSTTSVAEKREPFQISVHPVDVKTTQGLSVRRPSKAELQPFTDPHQSPSHGSRNAHSPLLCMESPRHGSPSCRRKSCVAGIHSDSQEWMAESRRLDDNSPSMSRSHSGGRPPRLSRSGSHHHLKPIDLTVPEEEEVKIEGEKEEVAKKPKTSAGKTERSRHRSASKQRKLGSNSLTTAAPSAGGASGRSFQRLAISSSPRAQRSQAPIEDDKEMDNIPMGAASLVDSELFEPTHASPRGTFSMVSNQSEAKKKVNDQHDDSNGLVKAQPMVPRKPTGTGSSKPPSIHLLGLIGSTKEAKGNSAVSIYNEPQQRRRRPTKIVGGWMEGPGGRPGSPLRPTSGGPSSARTAFQPHNVADPAPVNQVVSAQKLAKREASKVARKRLAGGTSK